MEENKLVEAVTTVSMAEAEQIIQMLGEHGIRGFRQGGILDVYTANSTGGEKVMVSREDLEAAGKLIREFEPIRVYTGWRPGTTPGWQRAAGWGLILVTLLVCVLIPLLFLLE